MDIEQGRAAVVLVDEPLELVDGYVGPALEDRPDGQALGNRVAVSVFHAWHDTPQIPACQAAESKAE